MGDGVIGPTTASYLFFKRIELEQTKINLYTATTSSEVRLFKLLKLESGFDPAAVGSVDQMDRGLAQINFKWHPDVVNAEAFDPEFSIPWAANYIVSAFREISNLEGAYVSYNVGKFYAKKWVNAGKPPSGIYSVTGKDVAYTCTRYINLLKKQ